MTTPGGQGGAKTRQAALNKKILCFIDEYGTAGQGDLHLGAVLVHARDAGRVDKRFSDQLKASASEIHATELDDGYLKDLMQRFWRVVSQDQIVMINQKCPARDAPAAQLYAEAVVQTVKAGLARFKRDVLKRDTIGNVEVIIDGNHHNDDPVFAAYMRHAQSKDGRFRGVNQVVRLDSAASRLLQLADVVAYSRKWVAKDEINAASLRERLGIQMP